MPTVVIVEHPLLEAAVFLTTWPQPLGEMASPAELLTLSSEGAKAPMESSDKVRKAVRNLLRAGGFKPTGRNKPASEYLLKARKNGWLLPINPAVDACNAVSLHSGLPISVVDADVAVAPYSISLAGEGAGYAFNPSGQELAVAGLLSLFDATGPCGGPVKDSQRTKTHAGTTRTLSVVWGTTALPGRTQETLDWYLEMVALLGGETESLPSP